MSARTVYYAAMSADGFIATADGGVAWLDPYNSPDLGYEGFLARVDAVVLGRTTYDQVFTFGPWPYGGKQGLVVSSRPVAEPPEGTRAVTPAELPAALAALAESVAGDVWIVGGGRTARACLEAGLLGELELYVIPRLLGDGIPLFARGGRQAPLRLVETRAFANGIVKMRYAVEHGDRR